MQTKAAEVKNGCNICTSQHCQRATHCASGMEASQEERVSYTFPATQADAGAARACPLSTSIRGLLLQSTGAMHAHHNIVQQAHAYSSARGASQRSSCVHEVGIQGCPGRGLGGCRGGSALGYTPPPHPALPPAGPAPPSCLPLPTPPPPSPSRPAARRAQPPRPAGCRPRAGPGRRASRREIWKARPPCGVAGAGVEGMLTGVRPEAGHRRGWAGGRALPRPAAARATRRGAASHGASPCRASRRARCTAPVSKLWQCIL